MIGIRCTRILRLLNPCSTVRHFSEISSPTVDDDKVFPQKIEDIAASISQLNLAEVSDLNELLQKKLNIKPMDFAMPAAMAAPTQAVAEDAAEPVATKSSFNVKLEKFDASKKVPLIKELKSLIPDLNLVQAKKLVESAPDYIMKEVSKDEAEQIKKTLTELGAEISIE